MVQFIGEDYDPFWQIHPLLYLLQIREEVDSGKVEGQRQFAECLFEQLIFREHDRRAEFEIICLLAKFMVARLREIPCRLKDSFAAGQCLLALIVTSVTCRSAILTGSYQLESGEKFPIQVDILGAIIVYLRRILENSKEDIDEDTEHLLSLLFQFLSELTFEQNVADWKLLYMPLLDEEILYRIIDRLHYRPSMIDAVVLLCRLSESM